MSSNAMDDNFGASLSQGNFDYVFGMRPMMLGAGMKYITQVTLKVVR